FLIAETGIRDTFPKLLKELEAAGLVATAKRGNYASRLMPTLSSARLSVENGILLSVYKVSRQAQRKRKLPIPLILFLATVAVVFIDGMIRSEGFASLASDNTLVMAGVYTMSLMGILGIHELGHMIAAKKYHIRASWPYFIPSVPGVFLSPTFGAMI